MRQIELPPFEASISTARAKAMAFAAIGHADRGMPLPASFAALFLTDPRVQAALPLPNGVVPVLAAERHRLDRPLAVDTPYRIAVSLRLPENGSDDFGATLLLTTLDGSPVTTLSVEYRLFADDARRMSP